MTMKRASDIQPVPNANPARYGAPFAGRFKRLYSLRFHMAMILAVTAGAGLLATWGFHKLHMENVAVRYPLAVILSYAVFFAAVKVWLKCVSCAPAPSKGGDAFYDPSVFTPGVPDAGPDIPAGGGPGACSAPDAPLYQGGGSGGGGADRVFDGPTVPEGGDADAGGAVGHVLSGAADVADGEGGLAVVVCVAVLALAVAAVAGASIYLIYAAPTILSEAAFNVILAGSLVRSTKRIGCADWFGSVFAATWLPFAITFALALLAGCLIHYLLPGVTTVSELYRILLSR